MFRINLLVGVLVLMWSFVQGISADQAPYLVFALSVDVFCKIWVFLFSDDSTDSGGRYCSKSLFIVCLSLRDVAVCVFWSVGFLDSNYDVVQMVVVLMDLMMCALHIRWNLLECSLGGGRLVYLSLLQTLTDCGGILRTITLNDDENDCHKFDTCCICLQSFRYNDIAVELACHHVYHMSCLEARTWSPRGGCIMRCSQPKATR